MTTCRRGLCIFDWQIILSGLYACIHVCVCLCVCIERGYVCVSVCVCVCDRERNRDYVCVREWVCVVSVCFCAHTHPLRMFGCKKRERDEGPLKTIPLIFGLTTYTVHTKWLLIFSAQYVVIFLKKNILNSYLKLYLKRLKFLLPIELTLVLFSSMSDCITHLDKLNLVKFTYGGLVLGCNQLLQLPQLSWKMTLLLKWSKMTFK